MRDGIFCILPVRSLSDGKSRLSPALGPTERARLNERLFEQTLDCLEVYPGAGATLVASGAAEVLDRARRRGMIPLAAPGGGGHLAAAAAATAAARDRGARGVFVIPVDLPLITAAALRDLIAQAPALPTCLLVPDRHGAGTNLIYQSPVRLAAYAFGAGSFACHRTAAAAAGLDVLVRREPSFALDIDLPADYALWRRLTDKVPARSGQSVDHKAESHGV